MANTTLTKVSVRLKLENGTDAEGNIKYVNLSLGNLSKDNFDADKALAVKSSTRTVPQQNGRKSRDDAGQRDHSGVVRKEQKRYINA